MTFMLHSIKFHECSTRVKKMKVGKELRSSHCTEHSPWPPRGGLRNADDWACLFSIRVRRVISHALSGQLVHTERIVYIVGVSPDGIAGRRVVRVWRRRQLHVEAFVRGQRALQHVGTGHADGGTRDARRRTGHHHPSGTREAAEAGQGAGAGERLVEALGVVFGGRVGVAHAAAAA